MILHRQLHINGYAFSIDLLRSIYDKFKTRVGIPIRI